MILSIIQIVLAVVLIVIVLVQSRGTGLGAAFGGSGAVYQTKRGLEKTLHIATIIISILFIVTSLVNFMV